MSRLSAIYDDADDDGVIDAGEDVYSSYKYLGAGRIVVEDYEDIDVKLDYAANNFAGFQSHQGQTLTFNFRKGSARGDADFQRAKEQEDNSE
jgi:hypothetical protein